MKRTQKTLSFILAVLCLSCFDDNQNTQEINYYALTVGNSWVFENLQYNEETQTYEDTGGVDTVTITRVENILGDDYFVTKTVTVSNGVEVPFCNPNGEKIEYQRVYEGYLIDSMSKLKFVNNVFDPILDREIALGSYYFN